MNLAEIQYLVGAHQNYWMNQRHTMASYTRAYKGEMFQNKVDDFKLGDYVTVNTADAYSYIEGFVASLYSKSPALTVGPDAKDLGNPAVMEAVVNRFLFDKSVICEKGLRYSLIYPYSFFKLGLKDTDSILDAVDMRAVHPWDVVCDWDAESWEDSRFVGHRYFLPFGEAKQKFPGIKFDSMVKEDYLKIYQNEREIGEASSAAAFDGSNLLSYVEVYEFYDFMEDELIFFSPSAKRADKILDVTSPIPFRKSDGSPCAPLIPIYLSYSVDQPLRGYSALGRVYDQLWEINNLRTVWANGLRRDARIYLSKKGVLDMEALSILAENRDMSVVELDLQPDENPGNAIVPLLQNTFSPDYQIYKAEIRSDLDRGTVMAPFTRGIATNASATEIAALTQYSAAEVGRMARFFHDSIEKLGEVYQSLLFHLIMVAEKEVNEVVLIDRQPVVLKKEQFEGKFKYAFTDQSSTPIAAVTKRNTITQLLEPLLTLGVTQDKMLEYLVAAFDLPETLLEGIAREPVAQPGMSEQTAPPQEAEGVPVGGGQTSQAMIQEARQMLAEGDM